MAKKISKIGNAIEIADTLSGLIENSHPAKNCWYDEKMLENSSVVKISFINNYGFKGSLKFNLSDTVSSEDVAFTKETFRDFARNSMGFSGGGSTSLSTISGESGYSHTGAFAGKPTSNNYVWESGTGISYTQTDVNNETFKVFSLDKSVHDAVDNPYWSTPTPTGNEGVGLFQGANLPNGVDTLVDYEFDYDTNYPSSVGSGFEGSVGRIDLSDCVYGDQLRVRFDFNVIPQIANTTVEPALWYSNRDSNDDITFTFPLTTQPIFYGGGTVGNTYLNRVEISAWITSDEDVNALALPAIKSDNPVIIQPLGMLITIIR